jgi:hypothetical protein
VDEASELLEESPSPDTTGRVDETDSGEGGTDPAMKGAGDGEEWRERTTIVPEGGGRRWEVDAMAGVAGGGLEGHGSHRTDAELTTVTYSTCHNTQGVLGRLPTSGLLVIDAVELRSMYFVVMPRLNLIVILMTYVHYLYSINCPTVICLPSMLLFILWRDTTSELWTPVQFPLHCYTVLLYSYYLLLLAYYYPFTT